MTHVLNKLTHSPFCTCHEIWCCVLNTLFRIKCFSFMMIVLVVFCLFSTPANPRRFVFVAFLKPQICVGYKPCWLVNSNPLSGAIVRWRTRLRKIFEHQDSSKIESWLWKRAVLTYEYTRLEKKFKVTRHLALDTKQHTVKLYVPNKMHKFHETNYCIIKINLRNKLLHRTKHKIHGTNHCIHWHNQSYLDCIISILFSWANLTHIHYLPNGSSGVYA